MSGYNSKFLGKDFIFELPKITYEKIDDVALPKEGNEQILKYLNYSVSMNRNTRQAFYSAANADFSKNTGDGRHFRLDGRLESSFQLDNIYYKDLNDVGNPYDRGHLTRRDAVSWGKTNKLANQASRDSCYFTNVSLQHRNFNQDEWYALEKAVEKNNNDKDNKANVICGPIFSDMDRFVTPTRSAIPGRVPSAFWKIIAYIGKSTGELEINAFIVHQDRESMKAKKQVLGNQRLYPFKIYQSSTTLIERLTGLEFPDIAFDNNPMLFFKSDLANRNKIKTPQLAEVSTKHGADCGICFIKPS